jgi:hypothetical protein
MRRTILDLGSDKNEHLERNDQGLENEMIEDRRDELNIDGSVECRERLGGVLKYYDRRAA